jgi:hypothetical protein
MTDDVQIRSARAIPDWGWSSALPQFSGPSFAPFSRLYEDRLGNALANLSHQRA